MSETPGTYEGMRHDASVLARLKAEDRSTPTGLPYGHPEYELRYQIMDAHPMVADHIAALEARAEAAERALLKTWMIHDHSAGTEQCVHCDGEWRIEGPQSHLPYCIIPGLIERYEKGAM